MAYAAEMTARRRAARAMTERRMRRIEVMMVSFGS
jgi:hypothetical protein